VIGGNATGGRRGEEGFDDEGVTCRKLARLGELLLIILFSARKPFLKTRFADNERPGGSVIDWVVVEETFGMAAGAETEGEIPVIPGGGALAVDVEDQYP
jgi:hypothetical protein